jgi:hypothetical protein
MAASFLKYVGAPSTATGTSGFNLSPSPQGGQGAFGKVPGDIGLPTPQADLAAIYPNLSAQTGQLSGNIMSELQGTLSPETINSIQDNAARFGVSMGSPGSPFAGAQGLKNLGLSVEQQQKGGLADYLNAITGISKTQTVSPELQTQIAEQNSVWNAAPDPAAASAEQLKLLDKYLAETRGPAGGTGNAGVPWYNQGTGFFPGGKQVTHVIAGGV